MVDLLIGLVKFIYGPGIYNLSILVVIFVHFVAQK